MGIEGEIVQSREEVLGDHVQRADALKDRDEYDRKRAQAERDRRAGEQHDQRHDEDEDALRRGAQCVLPAPMPNGGSRPVTRL
jgi:hypothetical protein